MSLRTMVAADSAIADVSHGDWAEAMRAGDFARAWAINDRDLACYSGPAKHVGPRHLQRIWRGEALSGRRVLVRCYHGLGDTIQFVRFMPALRAIACEVTLWCQPELLPLMAGVDGIDRVMALHDGTPDMAFDVDIEIMEVPHAIRATREVVEMPRPYLKTSSVPESRCETINDRLAVGLVWEVGDWDKRRAVPLNLLRSLAGEGIKLYSLQRGPAAGQATAFGVTDISTADVCALAGRIVQLDLVICVDTMIAHLAGALGREAWVLLHSDCDWRWPLSGDTTFWYPSLRLFHQGAKGDWGHLLEEVRETLFGRSAAKRAARSPIG